MINMKKKYDYMQPNNLNNRFFRVTITRGIRKVVNNGRVLNIDKFVKCVIFVHNETTI